MAFLPLLLVNLAIFIAFICGATTMGIVLLIIAYIMKKRQLSKKKSAELIGDFNFKIKKKYLIPKVIGFICMIPLTATVGLILYAFIDEAVFKHTSLSYNVYSNNTEQVVKIIDRGVTPDCTYDSNSAAQNGEQTLLYDLIGGYNKFLFEYKYSDEEVRSMTLEMINLLIDKGADVNYVVYIEDKDYSGHFPQNIYSQYETTDRCGWTPLMLATSRGDLELIKLLVDNGADVNAVDYCGYNVIDIVAEYLEDDDGYEILTYYLDKGVDPNITTNYNQDSLRIALRRRISDDSAENDKIIDKLKELNPEGMIYWENELYDSWLNE